MQLRLKKVEQLIGFMEKALLKKKMHVVAVNNCMAMSIVAAYEGSFIIIVF